MRRACKGQGWARCSPARLAFEACDRFVLGADRDLCRRQLRLGLRVEGASSQAQTHTQRTRAHWRRAAVGRGVTRRVPCVWQLVGQLVAYCHLEVAAVTLGANLCSARQADGISASLRGRGAGNEATDG